MSLSFTLLSMQCKKKETLPENQPVATTPTLEYIPEGFYRAKTTTSLVMRSGPGKENIPLKCDIYNADANRERLVTLPKNYFVDVIGRSANQETIDGKTDYWRYIRPTGPETVSGYIGSTDCEKDGVWVFGGYLE